MCLGWIYHLMIEVTFFSSLREKYTLDDFKQKHRRAQTQNILLLLPIPGRVLCICFHSTTEYSQKFLCENTSSNVSLWLARGGEREM